MKPLSLGPNLIHRFYRGGAAIAELRGIPCEDEYAPEDWVGSATAVAGSSELGRTRLGDGSLLADAFSADPEAFFGPAHARRFGADPALLVKLLDAGERLPVHLHPDGAFAREQLGSPYGKTEAWWIAAVRERGAAVHVGFRDGIDASTLAELVERQDAAAMLRSMQPLAVSPGDAIFVPAGLPHAIGRGILLVELQEPSDLSILLEWEGFQLDGRAGGHLGLGFEQALEAADRSAWAPERVEALRSGRRPARAGVETLLPRAADPFFRAERILPRPEAELEPAFSIVVVTAGAGELETAAGDRLRLARGATLLVPFAAGACRVVGEVEAIRCLGPPGSVDEPPRALSS